ncbi:MAG: indole-3-glycerol-phosphate synthase, partial [Lachnospiraceae bacterium]|nr:indole-3-glycerol-phosphate synthase [Lachnospiraceae bacterium]
MADILQQLADHARFRTEEAKKLAAPEKVREEAERLAAEDLNPFRFEQALSGQGISFICEIKQASPSKGQIWTCTSDRHLFKFPYLEIAKEYETAGAECISVLTEPKWFLGSDRYLEEIVRAVQIPCLRKDFTVDPYMIYQAKMLGAAAVLLICSLLEGPQIAEYIRICDELGLSALVEAH